MKHREMAKDNRHNATPEPIEPGLSILSADGQEVARLGQPETASDADFSGVRLDAALALLPASGSGGELTFYADDLRCIDFATFALPAIAARVAAERAFAGFFMMRITGGPVSSGVAGHWLRARIISDLWKLGSPAMLDVVAADAAVSARISALLRAREHFGESAADSRTLCGFVLGR